MIILRNLLPSLAINIIIYRSGYFLHVREVVFIIRTINLSATRTTNLVSLHRAHIQLLVAGVFNSLLHYLLGEVFVNLMISSCMPSLLYISLKGHHTFQDKALQLMFLL